MGRRGGGVLPFQAQHENAGDANLKVLAPILEGSGRPAVIILIYI